MTITIDLDENELTQLRELTQQERDSDAVVSATREYLRIAHLKQLKSVSGKVDFKDQSEHLEALELAEAPFPN